MTENFLDLITVLIVSVGGQVLQDLSLQSLMQCCIAALQRFCNPLYFSSFKDNCFFCGVSI